METKTKNQIKFNKDDVDKINFSKLIFYLIIDLAQLLNVSMKNLETYQTDDKITRLFRKGKILDSH